MGKTIDKLADLEYNELVTLRVIEMDEESTKMFRDFITVPFSVLYKLSKEGMFSDEQKKIINQMFEFGICTNKLLIDKYRRVANGETITDEIVVENEDKVISPTPSLPTVSEVKPEKIANIKKKPEIKVAKPKIDNELPRRYGKEKIEKDIEAQGGKATPVQKAMLKVNNLKNIVVNLADRGKKDMLTGSQILSDVDCREIVSVVTIAERKLEEILKRKK